MSDHPKEQGIVSLERLLSYHKRNVTLLNNNKKYHHFIFYLPLPFILCSHFPTRERSTIKPESALPEDIIRTLWALLDEGYFKEIKQDDIDLLSTLISLDYDHEDPFHDDEDFRTVMQETFRPQYLQKKTEGNIEEQLHQNWLEQMYILWNFASDGSDESLEGYYQYERKREGIRVGSLMEIARKEKELFESVNIREEYQHPLEREILGLKEYNEDIIEGILSKIRANSNKSTLCKDSQNSLSKEIWFDDFLPSSSIPHRQHQRKALLRYFEYEIQNLQRKQVAECMTKVTTKRKTQQGIIYKALFQEAMDLGSIEINEQQLNSLNKLRETSLFQFYQVGWKSRLNYICHDQQGFTSLLINRKTEKTQQDYTLSPLLTPFFLNQEDSSLQSAHLFATMQACHECKLLYDRRVLSKCTHHPPQSSPVSPDTNFPSYYDPYLYFLLKQDSKIGEYASGIWKDSILANTYSTHIPNHSCGRYFCKMCIKGQSTSKCRFCQGVCNCSRCIRNNTIIRLKTLYAILGGDIALLERDSYFARLCPRPSTIPKETPQGRQEMIVSYKMQLEELRLMAHSLMRREMVKEEQFANEEAILREKLRLIDRQ